jgi:hypothetical protein
MLNHKVIANWVHFVRRLGLSDNLAERLALPKISPLAIPPPDFTTTPPHESIKANKKDISDTGNRTRALPALMRADSAMRAANPSH